MSDNATTLNLNSEPVLYTKKKTNPESHPIWNRSVKQMGGDMYTAVMGIVTDLSHSEPQSIEQLLTKDNRLQSLGLFFVLIGLVVTLIGR